jgi:hypothetical protein
MEEFMIRFGAYLILMVVAGAVGYGINIMRRRADLKAMPGPVARMRLLHEIRSLRVSGYNHAACLERLLSKGLRKGVAEGLLIDVEREQAPDLIKKKPFQWNGWTCELPANWREQLLDADLARETAVSVEGIGSAILVFFKLTDTKSYNSVAQQYFSPLTDTTVTPVTTWGQLAGEGKCVRGVLDTHKLPVEITVFCPRGVDPPFVIVQSVAQEEEDLMRPGFDLVKSTLRMQVSMPS